MVQLYLCMLVCYLLFTTFCHIADCQCVCVACVIGWLSHGKIYITPHIILTCRMPSDTPNSVTGNIDVLLSGETSMHEI